MKMYLEKKEMVTIDKGASGLTVSCLEGKVWLTQSGDPIDHLILPGMSVTISCKGKVVIVALNSATMVFNPVTKNNGIPCNGNDLFCKITEVIPRSHWVWRCIIGQY